MPALAMGGTALAVFDAWQPRLTGIGAMVAWGWLCLWRAGEFGGRYTVGLDLARLNDDTTPPG